MTIRVKIYCTYLSTTMKLNRLVYQISLGEEREREVQCLIYRTEITEKDL